MSYLFWLANASSYIPSPNFKTFFPFVIDGHEPRDIIVIEDILFNIFLVIIFGLQHSIMARKAFKKRITQVIPNELERSVFVLLSAICVNLWLLLWRPLPQVLWSFSGSAFHIMHGIWALGALMLFYSTFIIDHFELFGVKQSLGLPKQEGFQVSSLYKFIRHPIMTSTLIGFWCAPVMSVGRLVFAIAGTIYILVGTHYEEQSLINEFGEKYCKYKEKVPSFFPSLKTPDRKSVV